MVIGMMLLADRHDVISQETANDQAGLSDKMDETGGEVETVDPAASEEAQQ